MLVLGGNWPFWRTKFKILRKNKKIIKEKGHLVLVAQTVTQRKEDRMDVEPCYPLFSAELESAEALASSQ